MKPRKAGESDADYIKRLEHANHGLRSDNARLSAWAKDITQAVTILTCEGSLVFQAMAEKARVRSHPSVTRAVELFDSISHPQWMEAAKRFPIGEWPQQWDFDPPEAQSGDADMELNAPISAAIQYLEGRKFNVRSVEWDAVCEIIGNLQAVMRSRVEGIKDAAGFKPRRIERPAARPEDMEKEQLVALVRQMGWMALDLAQDMAFANEMLRRDLRASVYRRVGGDLYRLASMDWECEEPMSFDIKVFGDEAPF